MVPDGCGLVKSAVFKTHLTQQGSLDIFRLFVNEVLCTGLTSFAADLIVRNPALSPILLVPQN